MAAQTNIGRAFQQVKLAANPGSKGPAGVTFVVEVFAYGDCAEFVNIRCAFAQERLPPGSYVGSAVRGGESPIFGFRSMLSKQPAVGSVWPRPLIGANFS